MLIYFSVELGFAAAVVVLVVSGILVAMILGPTLSFQSLKTKKRVSSIRTQRPQAVLVDGMTPMYMTSPPPITERERRKAKSTGKAATLVVTPQAVELWTSKDSATLVRSIPNTPGITVTTEVVNFGKFSDKSGTTSIDHESIIITDRNGVDVIIYTRALSQALREVKAALNQANSWGYTS